MSAISKQVLDKEMEKKQKLEQAEADKLNAIAKEVYELIEAKEITVKETRKVLKGMLDALESSMVVKLQPLQKSEEAKTLKAFYAETEKKS